MVGALTVEVPVMAESILYHDGSRALQDAFETRRIDGHDTTCVLIDSVQSQANRMEDALQALWADRRIALPVVSVDFSSIAPEVGRVTSLTAPHRIADALLRDAAGTKRLGRDIARALVTLNRSARSAAERRRAG